MNKKELILLVICLVIGFGLRFYAFDKKSLWIDEVHTFNDSHDDLKSQIRFYQRNPTYLHPPLFFILTHQFYPFTKPERDLRIIPLIFGILSIPMFYFLSRQFSRRIALSCSLSLAVMTYHIYLSQDGRSYSLLLFLGMAGLYFFLRHLDTSKNRYLILVALLYTISFYTSYSAILFIAFSQILWFYRVNQEDRRRLSSFFILNSLILLLCVPWLLFIAMNYNGQPIMDPYQVRVPISLGDVLFGILHDWVPHIPLLITSVIPLIVFPFLSRNKRNCLILLALIIFPPVSLFLFCRFLNVYHFVTSRYFINFLPVFFIALYLSIDGIEREFKRLRNLLRLKLIFIVIFIASNLVILPLYYRSEKQDTRGLVNYLKNHLKEKDKIFVGSLGCIPGMLHYFGGFLEERYFQEEFGKGVEVRVSFKYQGKIFTLFQSNNCCSQYVADGSRLWIIADKGMAKNFREKSPCVLKGYFDASFMNYNRFPTDASMYLFLWDPRSPEEKRIDIPID